MEKEFNEKLVSVKFLKDFDGHFSGDVVQVEERLVYGLTEWEAVEVLGDDGPTADA